MQQSLDRIAEVVIREYQEQEMFFVSAILHSDQLHVYATRNDREKEFVLDMNFYDEELAMEDEGRRAMNE